MKFGECDTQEEKAAHWEEKGRDWESWERDAHRCQQSPGEKKVRGRSGISGGPTRADHSFLDVVSERREMLYFELKI